MADEEDADERALEIVNDPSRFAWLPRKSDVNNWEIMRQFCETVEPVKRLQRLLDAIHGRGAFGAFKDLARDFGIIEEWYELEQDALREIAAEWWEANGIEYVDQPNRRHA